MPKYELRRNYSGHAASLSQLQQEGWEPFGVDGTDLWFRRPLPLEAAWEVVGTYRLLLCEGKRLGYVHYRSDNGYFEGNYDGLDVALGRGVVAVTEAVEAFAKAHGYRVTPFVEPTP